MAVVQPTKKKNDQVSIRCLIIEQLCDMLHRGWGDCCVLRTHMEMKVDDWDFYKGADIYLPADMWLELIELPADDV